MLLEKLLKKPATNGDTRVDKIKVLRLNKRPSWSIKFVQRGMKEGWLRFHENFILLNTKPHGLAFRIIKIPGVFCCYCDQRITDFRHMIQHAGLPSPDSRFPKAYRRRHHFDCILENRFHKGW